ncbi:MAG: Fic family protein [Gammaproteobacteria bacterium]|nr:Fic family protein [Gammaproteobacteria bacterium]MDA7969588.1 Fic family protein [Gammaproteobacteria bacterium]MDA7995328.1 Fic family protein [Gammaproteobacteria bacterium]MDA8024840.1 Fic family protein [Gammaproteobacteria bacterium]CAJ2376448.1 MAG: Fic family protein [Arenicellales bacterium IbO2]
MPFEHLRFTRHWDLLPDTTEKLGQCRGLIDALAQVPLRPEIQQELMQVSLVKGAQASTAIEGNTLTEAEVKKVLEGGHLSESKAYQEREVDNILRAMGKIAHEALTRTKPEIITPQLLLRYHEMAGKNLSAPFNAVPGQFAQSQRVVAGYRCPPPGRKKNQVEGLVKQLCQWLQTEFHFTTGKQTFRDGIIQSIVTHIYIEWIHPFDDGNGRTGRLVEFYLLMRAGVPAICAHILSNHYNQTRPEYYAHIRECQQSRDLTAFIAYAVTGFLDGLREIWETVSGELRDRAWRGYVYDKFAEIKWSRPTFKRRRRLLLDMSLDKRYDYDAIQSASPEVARAYAGVNISTLKRDIRVLLDEELLAPHPSGKFSANVEVLLAEYPGKLRR